MLPLASIREIFKKGGVVAIPPTCKPVGFLATDFMTYNTLLSTINNVLDDNSIQNKAKEILRQVKIAQDSEQTFTIKFLPVTDGNGDRVSPDTITVVGDSVQLENDTYFIYMDNSVAFSVPAELIMYIVKD